MNRLLLLVGVLVLLAGCGPGKDSDDDDDSGSSPTPSATGTPGTGDYTLTVNGSNFDAFDGEEAFARVLIGTAVTGCGQSTVSAGDFSIVMVGALTDSADHGVEIFVNTDGNQVYDDGVDEIWFRDILAADATGDQAQNLNGNSGTAASTTWPAGSGCN